MFKNSIGLNQTEQVFKEESVDPYTVVVLQENFFYCILKNFRNATKLTYDDA